MRISATTLLIVAAAAGALLWSASQAVADYPPPVGSLSAAASDTTPEPGSDVTVTCTVLDNSGNPMANDPCTFTIASQPGGASFDGSPSTTKNTDANGVAAAVLSTGATPGTIVVEVLSGALTSQVTITTAAFSTTMSKGASAGDTVLELASTAGFATGDRIRFNPGGATEEENTIVGFGSVFLKTPLKFDHAPGELVQKVSAGPEELPATGGSPSGSDSTPWPLAASAAAGGIALLVAGAFVALRIRRSNA